MKFLGLTAICLSLSMTGFYYSFVHSKKMKIIYLMSHFFRDFAAFIKMYSVDISGVISRLSESEKYEVLTFLPIVADGFSYGCNINELWKKSIKSSGILFFLDKSTYDYILNFSEVFSKNSREELFMKCEEYAEVFEEVAKREENKWEKNRSFVSASGVLAAALVLLIFI